MKLCSLLFGFLAFSIPGSTQPPTYPPPPCGVTIQPGMASIIPCNRSSGICTIPLTCLQLLQHQDLAAIKVYKGETVRWVSDLYDTKANLRKFKFKGKFMRIAKATDGDCVDDKPDAAPFDDDFPIPDHQTLALTKNGVVSMDAQEGACYKHVLHVDQGSNQNDDDGEIDPHIIIGGQPPAAIFGLNNPARSYTRGSPSGRKGTRKKNSAPLTSQH